MRAFMRSAAALSLAAAAVPASAQDQQQPSFANYPTPDEIWTCAGATQPIADVNNPGRGITHLPRGAQRASFNNAGAATCLLSDGVAPEGEYSMINVQANPRNGQAVGPFITARVLQGANGASVTVDSTVNAEGLGTGSLIIGNPGTENASVYFRRDGETTMRKLNVNPANVFSIACDANESLGLAMQGAWNIVRRLSNSHVDPSTITCAPPPQPATP